MSRNGSSGQVSSLHINSLKGNSLKGRVAFVTTLFLLQACSTHTPAPIEERRVSEELRHAVMTAPDVYTVKSGDSLYAIAFRYGLDYRAVARWNRIQVTELIQPGQQLTLKEPPAQKAPATTRRVSSRPYEPPANVKQPTPTQPTTVPGRKPSSTRKAPPVVADTSNIKWQWPASGTILQTFDAGDPGRTGVDIGGQESQDIKAAAGGTVVYSGSGLIGYGELIIIKHNDKLLSAYAHNRKRLVRENDQVKAGQKVAEMGRNGSNRVMLHFEVREDGSPVNPLKYLPKR